MPPVLKPLKPKVVINTTNIFDPIAGTYNFNLLNLNVKQASHGAAGTCRMEIEDSSASLINTLKCGQLVEIYYGKTAFSTRHFIGHQELKHVRQTDKNTLLYEFDGIDLGSRLLQRIVNFFRIQKRQADGTTVDHTDNNVLIDNIVKDAIQQTFAYPAGGPTVETDDGISVSGVDVTDLRLPEYIADMKPLNDVLTELAQIAGRAFWIGSDKVLNFKAPALIDSGVLIIDDPDSALGVSWNQEKLAPMLNEGVGFEYWDSIVDTKNRIFGIGGDELVKDQFQETTSGGQDAIDVQYKAIQLQPKKVQMAHVAVYIDKLGTPTLDLEGEVREDDVNLPTGSLIKAFKVPLAQIGAAGWYIADLGAEKINTAKLHWLILVKKGTAANTFRWYRDSAATARRATSTDGITWTPIPSTYSYAFRTYTAERLLTIAPYQDSIDAYGLREEIVSDPAITERATMQKLIEQRLHYSKLLKRTVRCPIFPPDSIMLLGQSARIVNSLCGIDDIFELTNTEYNFSTEELGLNNYSVDGVQYYAP